VKQHLGRQSGVQNVEVSLIDGKIEVTPKEDGQIDPAQLLKATYDSGVTAAEMNMTAAGTIVKDTSGNLTLQVQPNRSFVIVPNEESKQLEAVVGSSTAVTIRGQLYRKPAGKKEKAAAPSLKLTILGVEKKE